MNQSVCAGFTVIWIWTFQSSSKAKQQSTVTDNFKWQKSIPFLDPKSGYKNDQENKIHRISVQSSPNIRWGRPHFPALSMDSQETGLDLLVQAREETQLRRGSSGLYGSQRQSCGCAIIMVKRCQELRGCVLNSEAHIPVTSCLGHTGFSLVSWESIRGRQHVSM